MAKAFQEDEIGARLDLRDQLTITIDPATARDFDDAITLTRELGLLAGDPKMHEFLRGARERRRQRAETEKFRRFATERIERISRHYRDLARAATHAEQCLRQGESDPVIHELAWSALERFRSFEARIEREGLTDLDVLRTEWGKSRAAA